LRDCLGCTHLPDVKKCNMFSAKTD